MSRCFNFFKDLKVITFLVSKYLLLIFGYDEILTREKLQDGTMKRWQMSSTWIKIGQGSKQPVRAVRKERDLHQGFCILK
jgi:hypothetical protein